MEELGSDKPEDGKKRKHEGEVEDLFAKLKKQRAAKAEKQVRNSVTVSCILQQLCSCGTLRCSISASFHRFLHCSCTALQKEDILPKHQCMSFVSAVQILRKQVLGKRKPAGSKDDIFGKGVPKARRWTPVA